VIAEVALAVVLLAGAGLLLRSFARLQKAELGFRAESALTFSLSLPDAQYPEDPQVWAFMDKLMERMKRLPGVTSAGAGAYALPLHSSVFVLSFDIEGRPPLPPGQDLTLRVAAVTPDFLRTLAVPVLRGRSFTARDHNGAPQVVLLNAAAARRFFPGEEALGKRIVLGWSSNGVRRGGEVVGIVGDYRQGALEKEADPQLYLPFAQAPLNGMSVVLRTASDPAAAAAAVRAQVRELDASLPLYDLQTLDDVVTASASQPKFYMLLLGGFAALALVLAAVGIYGVITYAVRQRTQEIGIRMALGATRTRVQRMVVGQGLILAGLGAAAGLAGALYATRALRSLLYEVSAADPAIYAMVALVLVLVAALASYLPARRAARTEPQLAIRGEA
jgi:putative ABC transport system permease protein